MDKALIDYFIKQTNKRFDKLEYKVDQLLKFKWQIISGSVFLSVAVTLTIQVVSIYFKVK